MHSLIASSDYRCFFLVISFGQTDHFLPFWPNLHRATKVTSALYAFFNNVIFLSVSRLDRLISDINFTGLERGLVKGCSAWSYPAFNLSAIVEKKQFIRLAFSVSFTANYKPLSSRFNGPIFFLSLGLVALDNTFQYAEVVFAFFS